MVKMKIQDQILGIKKTWWTIVKMISMVQISLKVTLSTYDQTKCRCCPYQPRIFVYKTKNKIYFTVKDQPPSLRFAKRLIKMFLRIARLAQYCRHLYASRNIKKSVFTRCEMESIQAPSSRFAKRII